MNIRMKLSPLSPALLLAAGLALSACDNTQAPAEPTVMEVEQVDEAAPAAADTAEPVVAETPAPVVDTVPTEALPPETKSSEESVQPDSDTLFY